MALPTPIPASDSAEDPDSAERCNRDCRCVTTDRDSLRRALLESGGPEVALALERPHLFSDAAVFVSRSDVVRIERLVEAVESVLALPAFVERALSWAPESARFDPGSPGAFVSYDFHLGAGGPRLIEINTNAGGALLSTALARAQTSCCPQADGAAAAPGGLERLEEIFVAMLRSEWRRQRDDRPLGAVAIVDDDPERQFLYPEFLMFWRLFRERGIAAEIADPRRLACRDGGLWLEERRIDLVYNRLTDFALALPEHAALRAAHLGGAAVVTPHPRAHALRADKRILTILTDGEALRPWGVDSGTIAALAAGIPRTVLVTPDRADALWAARNRLFFKPAGGFGSKAAYRGDKLTRRVWGDILAGCPGQGYVAQEIAPPSERCQTVAGAPLPFKVDLRAYVYDGRIQLLSARLYRGQTTNFQTPGGGLAAVLVTGG